MEIANAEAAVEAILFTMGEAVTAEALAGALEMDVETTVKLVHRMMDDYDTSGRGVRIIELDGSFQMCTSQEAYPYIIRLTHQPKKHVLTDVMLETLAIIAYKQPVTRAVVEKIRGVSSDHAINRLIEYNLVCETGRLDAPGRPILFGTTDEFLRTFGFKSSQDLPYIDPVKMEEFKTEAEEEAADADANMNTNSNTNSNASSNTNTDADNF